MTWTNRNISASDIITDIMEMKKGMETQRFFAMNRRTKEIMKCLSAYGDMIIEDDRVPDDVIVLFDPSPSGAVHQFIKVVDLKDKTPVIKADTRNRALRRAEERASRKIKKRRNSVDLTKDFL